ncbi:anaerobic sulfatase maturase [Asticcacaulis solisilvae]|uniref:anaerobic sulfatase maturase n=1 Tax=Asticcacaulis solisilvae TaxID=1217274 RepID=UPI003FD7A356
MTATTQSYHTIIKPSGAQCNLDCTYCFYLSKEGLLSQPRAPRMPDDVLEAHIRQYIESQPGQDVVFTWQGGEPTLMGLDFFQRAVALQARYKQPGQRVDNDLQTNGVLLDARWAEFLKANNFLVGLSIDGPRALHDLYRRAKGGQPTFDRVMAAAKLLRDWQIPFNVLCVVNNANARQPLETYRFLRDEVRPRVIQFIPGVVPKPGHGPSDSGYSLSDRPRQGDARTRPDQPDAVVEPWSVDGDDWGRFLSAVWDEWFTRDFGDVFVDQFENVVSMMLRKGSQMCVTAPRCGRGLAIEFNGDLYSCDHFVYPQHRLGNISDSDEGVLAASAAQTAFGNAKLDALPQACRSCRFLELCWGECPKNRFIATADGEAGLNYLCGGLKTFYGKATSDYPRLVRRLGPGN